MPSTAREGSHALGRTCAVPVKSQPRRLTAGKGGVLKSAGQAQTDFFGGGLVGKQAPQIDGQTPCSGSRQFSSLPAREGRPINELFDRGVVWLPSDQTPDQLDQGAPDSAVTAAVDGAFMALAVGGCEPPGKVRCNWLPACGF